MVFKQQLQKGPELIVWRAVELGEHLQVVPDLDMELKLNLHQSVMGCRLYILG